MEPVEPERQKPSGTNLSKDRSYTKRLPSYQLPSRLRMGDDVDDDVTAPGHGRGPSAQYMNQSIFGMVAAAGSKTDFNARFDESSDTGGEESRVDVGRLKTGKRRDAGNRDLQNIGDDGHDDDHVRSSTDTRKKGSPSNKLLRQEPRLSVRNSKRASASSIQNKRLPDHRIAGDNSSGDNDDDNKDFADPRDAPMMSRLLTAEARFEEQSTRRSDQHDADKASSEKRIRAESSPASLLATRLKDIFNFDAPETVVAEYPCWLLQSVLLQGYLYLTKYHVCFYAYLPKRTSTAVRTGYLSKRGKSNPKYKRYWFELKGDVLTYFSNPSNRYFPQGHIDLRYGISAALADEKDKENKDFLVTTDHRTYYFRADSSSSATEWVKTVQKTIFRSHNDGDSVKISLPIESIIEIEESPVVDIAETLKIRVVESEDSYAIDEYFFSFFGSGQAVMDSISSLLSHVTSRRGSLDGRLITKEDSTRQDALLQSRLRTGMNVRERSPVSTVRENARSTLMSPINIEKDRKIKPKASHESTRSSLQKTEPERKDILSRQKSENTDRSEQKTLLSSPFERSVTLEPDASSTDKETDLSDAAMSPDMDPMMSASQILSRSDVFRAPPKLRRLSTLVSESAQEDERSDEEEIPVLPQQHYQSTKAGHDRRAALQAETSADSSQSNIARVGSPGLRDIVNVGTYPLQRAGAFAGYIKNTSGRMSRMLATESMSYLEKVSGMWAGSRKHYYGENEVVIPDDRDVDPEDEEANVGYGDRFRAHFALSRKEKLQATYFGYLHRVLPLYGKVYISNNKFCFRSLLPGTRTKLVLPLKDIENVDKEKGFRFGYSGLVIVIRGHEELFFEFSSSENRDDCTVTLLRNLESVRYLAESAVLPDTEAAQAAKAEHLLLQEARRGSTALDPDQMLPRADGTIYQQDENIPILFDDGKASIINFKPPTALRVTCLTIGSRGDVQPYIALCKGLLAEGHKPRIATHDEFGPWIKKHGIEHVSIGGDPAELMRICVENGMFTYSFLKEASTKFRSWIDDLLITAWQACQDSDILIESPSAMAGIHIAEALGIPYFRAFTMPWTRTRAYPHAFAVPEHKHGGAYNYLSYVMFDNVFWKGIAGQVNRWRKRDLGLPSTSLERMQQNKVPFLYNFSPHVVAPPLDYSDWVRVTGYWFLDEGDDFTPAPELTAFIQKARADAKKLVYIGFGSIVVSDPAALTHTVIQAVLKADVRCILSKGWSDRLGDPAAQKTEIPLPSEIFQIKAAPHDWLFRQIDVAVHHGGAGTTGASLRAGVPTITKPFFGDQFFFGSRIEDLGVGICLKKINVSVLARALWQAAHSQRMIVKARLLGEQIRKENGVQTAIQALYRDLEYARTLVDARKTMEKDLASGASGKSRGIANQEQDVEREDADEEEESWTFVDHSNSSSETVKHKRGQASLGTTVIKDREGGKVV